ncbi:MAG TPA: nuclear transport factor 2 family protein [Thermoguttaceae bacterium]|nr:nuclear transport factor 2 family protein [Thermoguttaceae bacterium]
MLVRQSIFLTAAILFMPLTLVASEDSRPDPPKLDGEAKAIADFVLNSQVAGIRDRDVATYMSIWSDDAVFMVGRGEKPGLYDIAWTRAQVEESGRVKSAAGPDKDVKLTHDDVRVELSGDRAVLTCKTRFTTDGFLRVSREIFRLRKTNEGWRVHENRLWPLYYQRRGKTTTYTPEKWKELDADVARCQDGEYLWALLAALAEAWRFKETYAQAKEITEENEDQPAAWLWRAHTAEALGHIQDSLASYRRALALDPKSQVPDYVKAAESNPSSHAEGAH